MATKKFRCKVCGYVHEGDKAPEKCPACQAPASEFEEIKEDTAPAKKGIDRNSNAYTIDFARNLYYNFMRNRGRRQPCLREKNFYISAGGALQG